MKKATILVIEDQYQAREVFKYYLAKDFKVLIRNNGEEGIVAIEQYPAIELVLTDNEMPILNGFDVIEWIKQTKPSLPVVMMSGVDVKKEALDSGASMFFLKPFPDNLIDSIKYIIRTAKKD